MGLTKVSYAMIEDAPANVQDYGAKGDGVTDDTAAFVAALSASDNVFVPFTSTGYVVNGVTLVSGKTLRGENRVLLKSTYTYCLEIKSTSVNIKYQTTVQSFTFDMVDSPSGSTAIKLATDYGVVFGVRIAELLFKNCYGAITDVTSTSNYVVDLYVRDCLCTFTKGRQVRLYRSRGFITFFDFKIDHTYNTDQVTWEGARFADFIGVELYKFDVVGPVIPTATYQPLSFGILFYGTSDGQASIWMNRVLVDNTRGPGIYIENAFNVFGTDTCVFQNLGGAIELKNVTKSTFTNTVITGGAGLSGAASNANGLTMSNCSFVEFNGLRTNYNTGNGISTENTTYCNFVNVQSTNNTGSGMVTGSGCDRNIVNTATFVTNAAGTLTQTGSNSATVNLIPNSGTYTASVIGAAVIA